MNSLTHYALNGSVPKYMLTHFWEADFSLPRWPHRHWGAAHDPVPGSRFLTRGTGAWGCFWPWPGAPWHPVGRPWPVLAMGGCSRVRLLPWPCWHSALCRVTAAPRSPRCPRLPAPALFPAASVGPGRSRSLAGQQLAGSRGVGRAGAGGTPEAVPAAVTAREWPRAHLAAKPGCSPGGLVPTAAAPASPATGSQHPAEIIAPNGGKKELFQGRVAVVTSSFCTNGKQNRLTLF